jgi:hypothetical protein
MIVRPAPFITTSLGCRTARDAVGAIAGKAVEGSARGAAPAASTQPAWALAGRTLTAFPLAIGHARTPRCLGGMPEENVFDLGPRRPELPRAV